jgi:hypothetical protein
MSKEVTNDELWTAEQLEAQKKLAAQNAEELKQRRAAANEQEARATEAKTVTIGGVRTTGLLRSSGRLRLVKKPTIDESVEEAVDGIIADKPKEESKEKPREEPEEEPKAKEEPKAEDEEEALKAEPPVVASDLNREELKKVRLIRWKMLRAINDKYAVIKSYGGKCVVVAEGQSPIDPDKKVFIFQSKEAFEQWMANLFLPSLKKRNEKQAVGPWWFQHRKRRQYDGVVFQPLAPRIVQTSSGHSLFNTYLGCGVVPKQGDWSLMRLHVKEVLANGDPKTEDYIIRWCAWSVQHPDKLPLVALVLIGLKGRGKGTFARALERIFGDHSLQISSQRHIVGNFNAHLENLILMISDEAYWAGHKADAGTLQRMITEPTLAIEAKGYDVRNVKNRIHLLMLAEPGWSVPAGQDERRYAVYEVCDKVRDAAYFKALYREIEGDGPAAMLYDLQRMNLGDWHPREVYKTAALRTQQEMSLGHLEEWLLTLLDDGCLPNPPVGKLWMSGPTTLLNDAKNKVPRLRDLSFNALAPFLEGWGCEKIGGVDRYWRFPPLADMRSAWDQRYTPRVWSPVNDWGHAVKPDLLSGL